MSQRGLCGTHLTCCGSGSPLSFHACHRRDYIEIIPLSSSSSLLTPYKCETQYKYLLYQKKLLKKAYVPSISVYFNHKLDIINLRKFHYFFHGTQDVKPDLSRFCSRSNKTSFKSKSLRSSFGTKPFSPTVLWFYRFRN